MPKLNYRYRSFFAFLAEHEIPLATAVYQKWLKPNQESDSATTLRYSYSQVYYRDNNIDFNSNYRQWLGALQAFSDMKKDLSDTFKPYKSSYYCYRDAKQLFYGLGNVLLGTSIILGAISFVIGSFIKNISKLIFNNFYYGTSDFKEDTKTNTMNSIIWLTEGFSKIVRGITQLVTAPFTLFIKIPLRGCLTQGKNMFIENNPGIQKLVAQGEELIEQPNILHHSTNSLGAVIETLHFKFEKALHRGQTSTISEENEIAKYDAIEGLFGTEGSAFDSSAKLLHHTERPSDNKEISVVTLLSARTYLALFNTNSLEEFIIDEELEEATNLQPR